MTQHIQVHPDNPQRRLVARAVEALRRGEIIVYPTDSAYAIACTIGNRDALDRIRRIRDLDRDHNFTLVCHDLSALSAYGMVDNVAFRLLRNLSPGPYTFIMKANRDVPRRLQHPKKKTIGLRLPSHPVVHLLLEMLEEPILSTTLILGDSTEPLGDPDEIMDRLAGRVDLFLDAGACGTEPTTVLDMTEQPPTVVRAGKGPVEQLDDA